MTTARTIHLLLIEDCDTDCSLIGSMIKDSDTTHFQIETQRNLSLALARLAEKNFDVVILDLGLPGCSGTDTLKQILVHNLEVPIIVLTGKDDDLLGMEAMREGAQDYLSRGQLDRSLLARSLRYAIERHRLLAELHKQSLQDHLTGITNRRGFFLLAQQQIKLAKRMKRPVLLVVADLDGMKKINDTLGHEAGDRALIETAGVLRNTFRDSDSIGRIGGDEFAVCIMEDDTLTAEVITSRLEKNIRMANTSRTAPYELSLSAGIVRFDPDSDYSFEQMLAQADALMYEKKRGKQQHQM